MSKPPAFQLYADDFIAGTMGMTQAEVGAYIRLLCHQWSKGSIDSDPERLRRMAGGKVSDVVLEKFVEDGPGKICNPRLKLLQDGQLAYRKKQSDLANLRWLKEADHAKALPTHIAEACSPISNLQSPISTKTGDIAADAPRASRFVPPSVEECRAWFRSENVTEGQGDAFHAYYESNGWKVGKNKMQKWKGAAAGWKNRYLETKRTKTGLPAGGVNHVLINAENWEKQEEHRERVRAERERTAQVSAELDRKMRELEEQP